MEETKVKCKNCERDFGSEDALKMHNSAKHSQNLEKERVAKVGVKKIKNWIILALVFGVIFYGIFWMFNNVGYSDVPASEINIGGHQNIALHIHSDLEIVIDGEEYFIPGNIGVGNDYMRPLHTHDSSGEIHIEGPYKRDFIIGEFFEIWGETFSSECIFDYCTDNGELKMYVNGRENSEFENYVMRNQDTIRIEYDSV
jgi:hypothetical protein